jgi:SAM-dependent methyltransferase
MYMLEQMLDRLSENPQAWNILRRVVEDGFRGEKVVIARELEPWRDAGRREFLDFGCGTGEFARCFPAEHYTGVDIAPYYVRFAGRTYAGRFAVTSGAAIGLTDGQFDAALVLGVFHHMPDALVRTTVTELHRIMKPGAMLLVMEDIPPPDRWNVAGHVMHWLDRGGHIRTDAEYRALLEPQFVLRRAYTTRSGICDYAVYVLERNEISGNPKPTT